MKICSRVKDLNLYPRPENIEPENYDVFELQGAEEVKYYVDGMKHGFRTRDKLITDTIYANQHIAFNIDGEDKYVAAYLYTRNSTKNKIELIDLRTGKVVLPRFSAYKAGKKYLAFRIDTEDGILSHYRWGLFDMINGTLVSEAIIPTHMHEDDFVAANKPESTLIDTILNLCEAEHEKANEHIMAWKSGKLN